MNHFTAQLQVLLQFQKHSSRGPLKPANLANRRKQPSAAAPKVELPENPVRRQNDASPPIFSIDGGDVAAGGSHQLQEDDKENFLRPVAPAAPAPAKPSRQPSWSPQVAHHLDDSYFGYQERSSAAVGGTADATFDIRRETYVSRKEEPPPIVNLETVVSEITRSLTVTDTHDIRRETYVSRQAEDQLSASVGQHEKTFDVALQSRKMESSIGRETFVASEDFDKKVPASLEGDDDNDKRQTYIPSEGGKQIRKFALPVIESPPPEVTPAKPKFQLTVESPKQVKTTIIFFIPTLAF